MYRNIKRYAIRYTDVDAFDNLKMSSLLAFQEESAGLSADELGFGYNAIACKNLGFIIVNNYIELNRPIKLGEELELHTWPLKPRHTIFFRDYEIYASGEKVGAATTRWCMIDTKKYAVAPVSAYFSEGDFDGYNTERSVNFNAWKIPQTDGGRLAYSKLVTCSDYDHYFHVNNTKYADYLLDTFCLDELKDKFIKKLQITYVKQCKMGEMIDFYREDTGDCIRVDGKVGDEIRVQFRVELNAI